MNTDIQKQKLESEKKLLEQELASLGVKDSVTKEWEPTPEGQTAPEADESDVSDREEDFEERGGTMEVLTTRLADITLALSAISDGTYGTCTNCGKQIEEDRLEANPAAHTCKVCMEKV